MPKKHGEELGVRFLAELAETLDLEKTLRKLNIKKSGLPDVISTLLSRLAPKQGDVLHLYVDGGSRGNPGQAGAGAVLKEPGGKVVKKLKQALGIATNNVAEYSALVMALKEATRLGYSRIKVFADSELVVKQITGAYRVKSEGLKPLYAKAMKLLQGFETYDIMHIRRERNAEADRLANDAMDGQA